MTKQILITIILAGLIAPVFGQNTIVYTSRPLFLVSPGDRTVSCDLNGDGTPDFDFPLPTTICTLDVPSSGCFEFFSLGSSDTAQLLDSVSGAVQPFGTAIASNAFSGSQWTEPGSMLGLVTHEWSQRYGTEAWNGPLGERGVGYLGVRFLAADGLHYGWIRVALW